MPSKGDPGTWARQRLRPGQQAIDVGAAAGSVTQTMAQAVGPTGRIWAIEPDPSRSPVDLAWVTWLPLAAWSHRDTATLFLDNEQSSFWRTLVSHDQSVDVVVDTLDALVPERVDLIKVDTQGSEMEVLAGAERHLQECPIWILELWPRGLTAAGSSALALFGLLRACGYDLYWAEQGISLVSDDALRAWVERSSHGFINIVAAREALPA